MENEHQKEHEIGYTTEIIKDGRTYFQSLAQQLAAFVCKKEYEDYKLTAEYGFTNAQIYIETILDKGSWFSSPKFGPKKCIGVLLYDIELNRITLRKTNVNREIHEFHADGDLDDCFGIQYDIFQYLRDGDLIQIHTVENVGKVKTAFCYTITKSKAARKGRFLQFKGQGKQFFIPIAEFRKSDGKPVPKPKKPRGRKNGRVN